MPQLWLGNTTKWDRWVLAAFQIKAIDKIRDNCWATWLGKAEVEDIREFNWLVPFWSLSLTKLEFSADQVAKLLALSYVYRNNYIGGRGLTNDYSNQDLNKDWGEVNNQHFKTTLCVDYI